MELGVTRPRFLANLLICDSCNTAALNHDDPSIRSRMVQSRLAALSVLIFLPLGALRLQGDQRRLNLEVHMKTSGAKHSTLKGLFFPKRDNEALLVRVARFTSVCWVALVFCSESQQNIGWV